MKRLVIVGESNPYGGPDLALYHLPREASGNRLREHLGLTDAAYAAIPKVNLCAGPWRLATARARAMELILEYDVLVLLGVKVRQAFGGPPLWEAHKTPFGRVLLALPHPSGLNRAWNEHRARARARVLVRRHAPWVPWGEVPLDG